MVLYFLTYWWKIQVTCTCWYLKCCWVKLCCNIWVKKDFFSPISSHRNLDKWLRCLFNIATCCWPALPGSVKSVELSAFLIPRPTLNPSNSGKWLLFFPSLSPSPLPNGYVTRFRQGTGSDPVAFSVKQLVGQWIVSVSGGDCHQA